MFFKEKRGKDKEGEREKEISRKSEAEHVYRERTINIRGGDVRGEIERERKKQEWVSGRQDNAR